MRIEPAAAASRAARLPLVDAARGAAIVAMVVYHLSWDLRYFGFIAADVERDLGWVILARATAGSFLFIVGVSLVLAARRGLDWRRYFRRLGIVAASAAAITLVTWLVFPDSFIFFGILHNIAVSSVLGLAFLRAPVLLTAAAAVASFLLPLVLTGPPFDHWALVWLGLSHLAIRSNDFVPIFPWFGVVLAGIAAARLWLRLAPLRAVARPDDGHQAPAGRAHDRLAALLWLGRHSLVIYLLHQPILFGLVDVAARVHPPDMLGFEPQYLESCVASCTESDEEPDTCRRTCACMAERMQAEGLWSAILRQTPSVEQEMRYFTLVDECRAAAGS